jgi:hypothetical protein
MVCADDVYRITNGASGGARVFAAGCGVPQADADDAVGAGDGPKFIV